MFFADPGSFRDPAAQVFVEDEIVRRVVRRVGQGWVHDVLEAGALAPFIANGSLVGTRRVDEANIPTQLRFSDTVAVLEHERIPCITYPYEWTFHALRAAALLHLELHLALLDEGFSLSDATAYNVQFNGSRPIHIDPLSIVKYTDGDPFAGYGQFQKQFLNPLVLEAETGVPFTATYRGAPEGLTCENTWRLLPARKRLRPNYWTHIGLTARFDQRATQTSGAGLGVPSRLPKARLKGLLQHLRMVVTKLRSSSHGRSTWSNYTEDCTYDGAETASKMDLVARFCRSFAPGCILDIGCNTGHYSEHALANGARLAVGMESDRMAAESAFLRAQQKKLAFLPLYLDLANPTPSQGWAAAERPDVFKRLRADSLLALAVVHHLAIGRNIPLNEVISLFTRLAPRGLIEFVPKADPQTQRLLKYREDIFVDYTLENFRAVLASRAKIVSETEITSTGRRIFEYEA